jgi:protease-4
MPRNYASDNLRSMLSYMPITPEADGKAQKMGERFKAEVQTARGSELQSNVGCSTGEVWDGVQARKLA